MSTLQKYGGTVRKSRTGPPRKAFPKKRPPKARIEGAASAPEPPDRPALLPSRRNPPACRAPEPPARPALLPPRHQSSGMLLSKGAKGRSKKCSQPQTTKHLEKTTKHLEKITKHLKKTTKHLEKTTKHLVFSKCFVVFVTSKTGFGLRSCYFQAKLGLISPHFSMAGTMLRVTSSSRILHR